MATAEKLDLYKLHKEEYRANKKPALVDTARATYLTIQGKGKPGGEAFQSNMGALYGMAYTMKFTKKFAGQDYKVCGLEGLWWPSPGVEDMTSMPASLWNWKLIIRTPDFVAPGDLRTAATSLRAKGKGAVVDEVKLETIQEGQCVQVLHVGPYDQEQATVRVMAEFAAAHGLELLGPLHEIYLSDPRRVPPERLRTVLRQPVRARRR